MSRLPPPFGPFQALRRLGAGGMAETFVAIRRGPGGFEQQVCIKRILPAFEGDQEFVESFLNEAKTSAALRHANIVQVLDFGVADGTHYLALELIDGLDLRALLGGDAEERGTLDGELCTLIGADLCAALEHAHSDAPGRTSVVHRDVSPSNVLISTAGEVKLTDFGIARASSGRQRTATGIIKGKVPYMPPEYIEHGTFDPRGDLFSLGVLLYELLAGVRPFDGHSDLDTIRRIVAGQHTHLGAVARGAPPLLVQCVERLLVTHPDDRFASARAVLEALPPVGSHRVRRRLGDLVRERLRERPAPADPTAGTLPREALPAMTPAAYTPGPAAIPPDLGGATLQLTHTREPLRLSEPQTRPDGQRPRSRAWWALSAAGLLLCAVVVLALRRTGTSDPQVIPAPPAPTAAVADRPAQPVAAAPAPSPAPDVPDWGDETPTSPNVPGPLGVVVQEAPLPEPAPPSRAATHEPRSGRERRNRPRNVEPAKPASVSSGAGDAELKIFVQPYGDVWIDGKRLGQAPITIRLPPGAHEIGVGDGRPRERRTVTLSAGSNERLEIVRRDVAEVVE